MINFNDVSFSYSEDIETLKNINLHINKGECVLLCGKSGCGKTTLTKLINGLIPHFYEECNLSGEVTVNGLDVAKTEAYELAKTVGCVFQNPKSQFFNINSDAELAFGLENAGIPQAEINERINKTISSLNIQKLKNRSVFKMSGGEKQSLAFASVYAMNPEVYVLDEPTANLDEKSIECLKEQLKIIKSENKTIVIAEHRLWFLTDIVDRIIYMENGEISKILSRAEFLSLSDKQRIQMGLRKFENTQLKSFPQKQSFPQKLGENFSVKNLSCVIKDKTIFKDLSFNMSNGEILGITGSNGIGKTTLLNCISGLIKPSSGEILIDNEKANIKSLNKTCYMIMQDVNHQLFSDSVLNECKLTDKNISEKEINFVLSEFNLKEYSDNHPMALSGGQKQRLAIATGILSSKRIILFDEPTSGLDYENMILVGNFLKNLALDGHMVIVVTHDNELLDYCANQIYLVKGG